ncbi:MAG: hypothetical protein JNM68_10125 [Dinghuibacter sp.]|nr:hypothetical protein [Dinghuibacter sp.]
MKLLYAIILLLCTYRAGAQAVFADPALGQAFFTSVEGTPVDLPPVLAKETVYVLNIPVYNKNLLNAIQQGTTKLKIGLGSKLILDPSFNIATSNTSNWFSWTSEVLGGQVQLTGDQFTPIPAGFSDTARFLVRGIILGVSTVTANFLVTNHNGGGVTLSDDNGANNLTAQAYLINESLPVTFVQVEAREEQCTAMVRFTTANEYNLARFIVEFAVNGQLFQPAVQLMPRGNGLYEARFPVPNGAAGGVLYVRVRSVDIDGRQQFSEIRSLRSLCNGTATITAYPNPVRGRNGHITIQKNNGFFNGQYMVTLFNAAGGTMAHKKVQLNNTRFFDFPFSGYAAGAYKLRIVRAGEETITLNIHKTE